MTMSEAAHKVLFSSTLEEKLHIHALDLADESRGPALLKLDRPTRPDELQMSSAKQVPFPKITQIHHERERGVMLHFLANHELLAAELMALVLLKFPDAPNAYRRGVYEAMREEQMHTRMYLRRMEECGVPFGELPLNDYFWKMVSPVQTPLEFVTKLNLTFEQANLDFSYYYAEQFRVAGDLSTATVLEKIYRDEIGHVGHGVHWLREWKNPAESDWKAYHQNLQFPLSPSRAKGLTPFNAKGRQLAGLDQDFIETLQIYEHSRGRTPHLHWFNPHAEEHVAAHLEGRTFHPKKIMANLENDLEMLMLPFCHPDDILLLRNLPRQEHLRKLREGGVPLCQFETCETLDSRKLGGLSPWAWSPDAINDLQPFQEQVTDKSATQAPPTYRSEFFSKRIALPYQRETSSLIRTLSEFEKHLANHPLPLRVKALYACSGRSQFTILNHDEASALTSWAEKQCQAGGFIIEPYYNRLIDFSSLYQKRGSELKFLGFTRGEYTPKGQYQGSIVDLKWGNLFPPEVCSFLAQKTSFLSYYQTELPAQLSQQLSAYEGPLAVDAFLYRENGEMQLRPVVEINLRYSMGRVAHELMHKTGKAGSLKLLKTSDAIPLHGICLNDPETARSHLAIWTPKVI